jgi:hypothetical protein
MKRAAILAILGVASLILIAGWSFGKKEKEKPVQERFEAVMSPSISTSDRVFVAIREFSTDQELQALARTFAQGGEKALEKALGKVNKGQFRIGNEETMPILIITSTQEGDVRKLNLIGKAPTIPLQGLAGSLSTQHSGFPYTFIQLQVNDRGVGRGAMILYVNLGFNPQGRISIKPMDRQTVQLGNVHKP